MPTSADGDMISDSSPLTAEKSTAIDELVRLAYRKYCRDRTSKKALALALGSKRKAVKKQTKSAASAVPSQA